MKRLILVLIAAALPCVAQTYGYGPLVPVHPVVKTQPKQKTAAVKKANAGKGSARVSAPVSPRGKKPLVGSRESMSEACWATYDWKDRQPWEIPTWATGWTGADGKRCFIPRDRCQGDKTCERKKREYIDRSTPWHISTWTPDWSDKSCTWRPDKTQPGMWKGECWR